MKKSVLIINYYYPPINNGGVQRIVSFKKYLEVYGFHVSILTTNSYGVLSDDDEKSIFRYPDGGVEFIKKSSQQIGLIFRLIRRLQLYMGLITDGKYYWKKEVIKNLDKLFEDNTFDIVIASYPTPAALEIGEIIHKKYNIPLIVDYRDGLMFDPFSQYKRNSIFFNIRLRNLEKRLAKNASLHLTVNDEMNDYYSSHYPKVKSVVISNGFDDEEELTGESLTLPEGKNVIYTGALSKSREIYNNAQLFKCLEVMFCHNPSINYTFVGDYTNEEKEFFGRFANVKVWNKMPRQIVLATQRSADAFLLVSGPKGGTSGKLYEYLFAKKPIINIGGKEGVGEIINGINYGSTCDINDLNSIIAFIDLLYEGKIKYEYPDLIRYTRRFQCEKLATELKTIIG